jgi:hypothetical protein
MRGFAWDDKSRVFMRVINVDDASESGDLIMGYAGPGVVVSDIRNQTTSAAVIKTTTET